MTTETTTLGVAPGEDPFVIEQGGFYRRWMSMIGDMAVLERAVASLTATTEDAWVPVWREVGKRYEDEGDAAEAAGDHAAAREAYLQAKTYYSIGRFPGEISEAKRSISEDCNRAYRKACAHLDPPIEYVDVECEGMSIRSHFRAPAGAGPDAPAPAVLIMCGGDMFKEDRGWAAEMALAEGLASLVMDAPGTGENPFPYEPASVKAWVAAVDYLAGRPEVDAEKIGAFGISRGGYSVMQLAGTYPERVRAVVAIAGHPFGYRMTDAEVADFVAHRNRRAEVIYGAPGDPPTFPTWSVEKEQEIYRTWALSELGILENITMPILMINGKHDHLAPIGNIYFMLEHGPATGREARVYADAGHCAFKYYKEWAPASFRWFRDKLG
jgi:pimeloyl-ACP methyl ester carboxylesterase